MIYVSPNTIPCNQAQLLSSLHHATTVFQSTNSTNSTSLGSSDDVCYALYAHICQPFFSAACRNDQAGSHATYHVAALDAERPPLWETWGIGLLFICMVCSCAAFGLCLYPIMKKKIFHYILTWLIGLAIGSLSGIAVFHLIPHSFELPDETPEQIDRYIHKSLVIVFSIYVFFLSERIFKMSMDHRKKQRQPQLAMREVSRVTTQSSLPDTLMETPPASETSETVYVLENGVVTTFPESVKGQIEGKMAPEHAHFHGHEEGGQPLQTIAWLILSGDSIVDGLSIGAAFSMSTLRGISISVAVLCEELPHELGDLAILLHSGMSLKKAILYNCVSGLTCFVGFAVGVFLGELTAASTWIFAVASGMFIYISFVNILPEMSAAIEDAAQSSTKQAVLILSIQTFGIMTGIMLMYVLARFSGHIQLV